MLAEADKCPDSCEVFKIGRSYEGKPLYVFKVNEASYLRFFNGVLSFRLSLCARM